MVSTASCAPPCKERPSATTSNLLLSTLSSGKRSKSLTITLVRTLAPASLQSLSSGKRLLPRTPELHMQTGGGQRRREDGHTGKHEQTGGGEGGKGWESNCVNPLVGKAVEATDERGPHCDLIKALSWADKVGQIASLMNLDSRCMDATFCQPWVPLPVTHLDEV